MNHFALAELDGLARFKRKASLGHACRLIQLIRLGLLGRLLRQTRRSLATLVLRMELREQPAQQRTLGSCTRRGRRSNTRRGSRGAFARLVELTKLAALCWHCLGWLRCGRLRRLGRRR